MNGPADPRVNAHHPDHVHDWHGEYGDDGRYEGDVCRCGATAPDEPLGDVCGRCKGTGVDMFSGDNCRSCQGAGWRR